MYNEEINIVLTIKTISDCMEQFDFSYEVIIVDDASKDDSYNSAYSLLSTCSNLKLFKNERNLGFASSYFNCLKRATAKYVQYISADNDIDAHNLSQIVKHLGEKPVILQYCNNSSDRSVIRYAISQLFVKVMNVINKKPLKYYNGFNIFPRVEVEKLSILESSFAFQTEMVVQLVNKMEFMEVGIEGSFKDQTSSALEIGNVMGVIKYILKKLCNG